MAVVDILKSLQLPLGLKAPLSASGGEQGMRIQQASWNDIILGSQFYDGISDRVKVFSGSHSPSRPTTHP